MKRQNGISFAAFIVITAGCVTAAEANDTQHSNRPQVASQGTKPAASSQAAKCQEDLRCTYYCTLWNWCMLRTGGDISKCGPEPEGCDCTHF